MLHQELVHRALACEPPRSVFREQRLESGEAVDKPSLLFVYWAWPIEEQWVPVALRSVSRFAHNCSVRQIALRHLTNSALRPALNAVNASNLDWPFLRCAIQYSAYPDYPMSRPVPQLWPYCMATPVDVSVDTLLTPRRNSAECSFHCLPSPPRCDVPRPGDCSLSLTPLSYSGPRRCKGTLGLVLSRKTRAP